MERIAIISDSHGNLTALEAVAKDIRARGISRVFCLGDLVGKGPQPKEVIALTRKLCEQVVLGNWEEYLNHPNPRYQEHDFWQLAQLDTGDKEYMLSLPFAIDFWMSGRPIRLFHASNVSVFKRVFAHAPREERMSLFGSSDAVDANHMPTVVGYADIHYTFMETLEGKTLFNTGSVGNPLDFRDASYVIMEGKYGSRETAPFSIQFIRVPYDIEEAVSIAEKAGMPLADAYALELRSGIYRGLKA